jgi:Protein of unknown function (DUF1501)
MFPLTRRDMLQRFGLGLGAMAFADLFAQGADKGQKPHHAAKAKRVVHIFPQGGPSQMDTFDPKPGMKKWDGKPMPGHEPKPGTNVGAVWHSPWKFEKRGKSGLEISELFPELSKHADDLCVIRSAHTINTDHQTMAVFLSCGDPTQPRPSVGSWVQYGLGIENQNLPAYVVLNTDGKPLGGAAHWQSSFLPTQYQGSYVDTAQSARRADELIQHVRSPHTHLDDQRAALDLLKELNRDHADKRDRDAKLEGRLSSFELAYRMQIEATDAFDLHREPRKVIDAYGDTPMGRQMLLTRRLLERGVRYVQIFDGDIAPWDDHGNLYKHHGELAKASDQPIAAFLADLKRLGLFDETLVVWASEFGRTATAEHDPKKGPDMKTAGRDHNGEAFSIWLAGGGVKGGQAIGETDEWGMKGIKDRVHIHDLHATMLHLLGFDHEKLTYRYAGRDFRLTDVHGKVVKGVVA